LSLPRVSHLAALLVPARAAMKVIGSDKIV
jgi:hypothetical protein